MAQPTPLKRFALRFALLCTFLYGLCAWLPDRFFTPVNHYTAAMTAFLLARLGFDPELNGVFIALDGFRAQIITECSAIMVLILFGAFVTAYPAALREKGVGLVFGIPLLLGANFIRLVLVLLTGSRYPALFEVAHLYLGQFCMVSLVFAACLLWLKTLARPECENTPLGFLIRFAAITAIPFVLWLYLHRGYVQLDAWIVVGIFKLFGHTLHLSPNMEMIYPNTFSLIAFSGLILASRGIDRRSRMRSLWVGLGILAVVHVLFRILQVFLAISGRHGTVQLMTGLLILNTYLLPFVLWLVMVRQDLFNLPRIPTCPYCGAKKIGMEEHIRAKHGKRPARKSISA